MMIMNAKHGIPPKTMKDINCLVPSFLSTSLSTSSSMTVVGATEEDGAWMSSEGVKLDGDKVGDEIGEMMESPEEGKLVGNRVGNDVGDLVVSPGRRN